MPRSYQLNYTSLTHRRQLEDFKVICLFGLVLLAVSFFEIESGVKISRPKTHDMEGSFLSSTWRFLVDASKFCVSIAAGSLVLFAWYWGVNIQDVVYGFPFYKRIVRIRWPSGLKTSNTKTVVVSFLTFKKMPYTNPLSRGNFVAEVIRDNNFAVEGTFITESADGQSLEIVFSARVAGIYEIRLRCDGQLVKGFPSVRRINPGSASAKMTKFEGITTHTLVFNAGSQGIVRLSPRDQYDNLLAKPDLPKLASKFEVSVFQIGDTNSIAHDLAIVFWDPSSDASVLNLAFEFSEDQKGWFEAKIFLDGKAIGSPSLTVIVLNQLERFQVDEFMKLNRFGFGGGLNYFVCDIVSENGEPTEKPRRAFCYLSSKQLVIKEYFLRVFPKRRVGFRVGPSTKIKLVRIENGMTIFQIKDRFLSNIEISACDGTILSACFYLILLKKLGGSESFSDKKEFFYNQLRERNSNQIAGRIFLKIDRNLFVESSFKATKNFSDSDWSKLFVIEFSGEPGIDQGGLRREWFDVLSRKLFDPELKLFVPVEPGGNAVIPNPFCCADVKKSGFFKFAGKLVGKCIFEGVRGDLYKQQIPVRLAKSFLAQLVGLRVHFRHFADDAPQYYTSKIRVIETTRLGDGNSGLDDLNFTEEEFIGPSMPIYIDLKQNGSTTLVTESNKLEYLDLLAQYRLCTKIKEQTEQFLEGLNSIIPDDFLSLFDENELELLICGVKEYKLSDLKIHHSVVSNGLSRKTEQWFWLALEHFTQEQFAKLMQFTTGSSQLPMGGFANLSPKFQISSSGSFGNLPTASTCINLIFLPEHKSFAEFERALLTAITEGNEGFSFS